MSEHSLLMSLYGFIVFLLSVLIMKVNGLQKRATAVTRVERKVDLLLKEAGIEFDPWSNIPAAILEAAESGNSMLAARLYRDWSGADSFEATLFIEELTQRKRQPV
jgi:hypothetical protein